MMQGYNVEKDKYFFIPASESESEAIEVYNSIINNMAHQGYDVLDKKIYKIDFNHNGKDHKSIVGEKSTINNEIVIAIFETSMNNLYLTCTYSRGVVIGSPIMSSAKSVTCFDVLEDSDFLDSSELGDQD